MALRSAGVSCSLPSILGGGRSTRPASSLRSSGSWNGAGRCCAGRRAARPGGARSCRPGCAARSARRRGRRSSPISCCTRAHARGRTSDTGRAGRARSGARYSPCSRQPGASQTRWKVCAPSVRQGFGSPSRHSDNMCSTHWRGKRGKRWARSQTRLTTSFGREFAPTRLAIEDEFVAPSRPCRPSRRRRDPISVSRSCRPRSKARTASRASAWSTSAEGRARRRPACARADDADAGGRQVSLTDRGPPPAQIGGPEARGPQVSRPSRFLCSAAASRTASASGPV